MKTVQWLVAGCRILALACGLTVAGGGCGESPAPGNSAVSQEETKRNADTQKAMEEAAKHK